MEVAHVTAIPVKKATFQPMHYKNQKLICTTGNLGIITPEPSTFMAFGKLEAKPQVATLVTKDPVGECTHKLARPCRWHGAKKLKQHVEILFFQERNPSETM